MLGPHMADTQFDVMLSQVRDGDTAAKDALVAEVHRELSALAASYFRGVRSNHTLAPDALVSELYLRLIRQDAPDWRNRAHFMAVAATAMRQILVDHSRRKQAAKRGSGDAHLTLSGVAASGGATVVVQSVDLLHALDELARLNARQAKIVELRGLGGLKVREIAEVLEVSIATVENDWRKAKAWLALRLRQAG